MRALLLWALVAAGAHDFTIDTASSKLGFTVTRPGETRRAGAGPLRIPLTVRYDEGSVTADGATAFTLSEFGIPIPKIFWIVLDDKVTVTFHAVAKQVR